ncbi:MAG: hypothetical protein ACRD3I_12355, partial [Terriglobales bacterium]
SPGQWIPTPSGFSPGWFHPFVGGSFIMEGVAASAQLSCGRGLWKIQDMSSRAAPALHLARMQ